MESFIEEFEYLKIPLKEIISATNKFSETAKIGGGGFGLVYRGELSHFKGRGVVAIKRLDPKFGQGGPEFWKEITILTRHRHKNLISLLGFCIEGCEMILVYEYASNRSLDKHLRSPVFTWTQRLKICLDAARGLSYLHDTKDNEDSVIHCDIKSYNILIDADWNAKVSDMGLSKIVPANQHTGHFTNPAGTHGYVDPEYIKTGFLTKESDVYSFGVVLHEVLSGTFSFDRKNNLNVVPTWIESYKQNKSQEIIFDDLKQQIYQKSLETYLDIAFKCLQESGERPKMPHVEKELEKALLYQELYERLSLPQDYKEMLMITEEDPLNYMTKMELKMLLLKGTLRNKDKTWLSFNMEGESCELISITECLKPNASEALRYIHPSECNSRFAAGCYEPFGEGFKTRVQTQFLSPQIKYTVNLVFKRKTSKERYIGLEYKLKGEKENSYSFVSDEREDGWLTAELYQFTSDQKSVELEIQFHTKYCKDLLVEGIEFQPLMNLNSPTPTPTPNLYEGHLFKHYGEERFSFAKEGKKCLMLPAIAVLEENKWEWKSLPDTRFEKVADQCITKTIGMFCKFSSEMLSPQTTYATYLVYKLPPDYNVINPPPVQVVDKNLDSKEEYNIFLRTPQTPVIERSFKIERTYNPSIRPMIKGLPKLRSDKWMEVQVHEFQTRATFKMISTHLRLSSNDKALKGITVQGLEFRPT